MSPQKFLRILVAAALVAVGCLTVLPQEDAAAEVDVYTTPGYHTVNGREWHTVCEPYSQTVRCTTRILATQVTFTNGAYVQSNGWVFNNLTYLAEMTREQWADNPLANTGSWTATDGRQWRTECDTAVTGRGGCRSYIRGSLIGVVSENPRTYGWFHDVEVFNSMVRFKPTPPAPTPTPEPGPCNDAWIPSGFDITSVNGTLRPHAVKTPYSPNTLYNPTSITNFTRAVLKNTGLKGSNPDQWNCLLQIGTDSLLAGSTTDSYDGDTVRWFPYMFEFDPSPTDEISTLQPGWISGLAQGSVLAMMAELHTATGDQAWLDMGHEVLNSFRVPFDDGGFTHRDHGVLWFEEYPSAPPTTVLNGHNEAIIGLDIWARKTGDQFARDLFNEAIVGLQLMLPEIEVPVQGGILSSYDLVRGYEAAPLRLTYESGTTATVTSASLNGQTLGSFPLVPRTSWWGALIEPFFAIGETGWQINKWTSIAPPAQSTVTEVGGVARFQTSTDRWQGIQQVVPASRITPGADYTLKLDSRLTIDPGVRGLSGRVAVYEFCDAKATRLVYETQKNRGQGWATYTMSFNADVSTGCGLLVQLLTGSYGKTGTTVEYRNISLGLAQTVGDHHDPSYGLYVHESPEQVLTLQGSGTVRLQAYMDGMWQHVSSVTLSGQPTDVVIPELYTGRNLHYGYHETHVYELVNLYQRAMQADLSAESVEFLRARAEAWEAMAPSQHGIVPAKPDSASARTMQQSSGDAEFDGYNLPLIDHFELLQEE